MTKPRPKGVKASTTALIELIEGGRAWRCALRALTVYRALDDTECPQMASWGKGSAGAGKNPHSPPSPDEGNSAGDVLHLADCWHFSHSAGSGRRPT